MSATRERPPGPRFAPAFRAFTKDQLGTLERLRREFGDIVFVGGPLKAYVLSHTRHARHVFEDNFSNWPHPPRFDALFANAAAGVATVSGDEWRRQRALVEPVLRPDRLAVDAAADEAVDALLARWDARGPGAELDLREEMDALSRAFVGRVVFGADWDAAGDALGRGADGFIRYLDRKLGSGLGMVPEAVPIPTHLRRRRAARLFDAAMYPLIARRRAVRDGRDVVSGYLEAVEPRTGTVMSDEELRGQLAVALVAGHVPLRAALTWACYLLATHPEEADRVRGSVADALGERRPRAADVPQLSFAGKVVREALRLYAPLPLAARTAVADDEIDGYRVPAGSIAVVSAYVIHRHPDFWDDAERFDPDRFDGGGDAQDAWLPFIRGPRQCPGMELALTMLTLAVAAVAQRYRLEHRGGDPHAQPMLGLEARAPVRATLAAV